MLSLHIDSCKLKNPLLSLVSCWGTVTTVNKPLVTLCDPSHFLFLRTISVKFQPNPSHSSIHISSHCHSLLAIDGYTCVFSRHQKVLVFSFLVNQKYRMFLASKHISQDFVTHTHPCVETGVGCTYELCYISTCWLNTDYMMYCVVGQGERKYTRFSVYHRRHLHH